MTPQRTRFRHRSVRPRIHLIAPAALRPGTMSNSTPRRASTIVVPQCLARNRPRRNTKISSRPNAVTPPMRDRSASSSAAPQRRTALIKVCQPMPSSAAISLIARPMPARRVACRAATAGDPRPGRRDPRLLLGEGACRARVVGAAPAVLVPHQPHRPPQRRQIAHAHLVHVMNPHRPTAARTARPARQLHADPQRAAPAAADPGHRHTRTQTDDQQQRTRKVNIHRDPPEIGAVTPPILGDPSLSGRDPHRATPRAKTKRHKSEPVRTWLSHPRRKRWHLHFTPTSSSWANLVEGWFSILTRKALKTQAFTSVEHLKDVIEHWAAHWNHDPKPLKWTKTADQIIAKVKRARTALNKTATHH